jgi:polysaccharide export outer membrane protein
LSPSPQTSAAKLRPFAGDVFAICADTELPMPTLLSLFILVLLADGQALSNRPASPGPAPVAVPAGYVIGADDRLTITFWGDKDLSADVVVRPDGRISLPLLNDVEAAGLTPEQLRQRVVEVALRYVEDPSPTVTVREIHSRQVYITGNVEKPGAYPLNTRMTVVQVIATAGGLKEFVAGKNIVILRHEAGRDVRFAFDYQAVLKGRKLQQNIEMRPGDTVIVP